MRTRILLLAVLVALPMFAQRQRVARPAQLRDDGTNVTLPPGRNLAIGTTVLLPAGFCGDGTVDKTAAINAAIAQVMTAGGGIVQFPAGTCLVSGQILIPNDADTIPKQKSLRLLGVGGSHNTPWSGASSAPFGGTVLDLRYNGPGPAAIDTRGLGYLEMAYFSLVNGGTGNTPMFQTTNTLVNVHDNFFRGADGAAPATCDQDAIVMGGTDQDPSGGSASAFEGYTSIIWNNQFSAIRRGVYLRTGANSVVIRENTWHFDSGAADATVGAIECDPTFGALTGTIIQNNTFESNQYPVTVLMTSNCRQSSIIGNGFYDSSGRTVNFVKFLANAKYNTVIAGVDRSDAADYLDEDGTNVIVQASLGKVSAPSFIGSGLSALNALEIKSPMAGQVIVGTNSSATRGSSFYSTAGTSANYNAFEVASNSRGAAQANTSYPSWLLALGGGALEWQGKDVFAIGRVAAGGAYATPAPMFRVDAAGNALIPGTFSLGSTAEGGCLSVSDLAVDAISNIKVTSASWTFVAADVGGLVQVTAGAGWTVGSYRIVSVAAGAATLDKSPAAVGVTGGSASINRGRIVSIAGAAGVSDSLRVCRKDDSNAYAWTALY
jgi:hypothetical protein